ncbi:MAG: hypothetical protein EP319_02670, partial [Deltaproteobacteria bacterium]
GLTKSKTLYILPLGSFIFATLPLLIKKFGITNLVLQIEVFLGTAIIFARSLSTGGLNSPVIFWLAAIPMVASVTSVRSGIAWTFVSTVLVFIVWLAPVLGLPINTYPIHPAVNAAVLSILLMVLGTFSIIYESQRARNEEIIRRTEKELSASKKLASLGNLSGGIAHEINNPLAIAVGRVGMLKKYYERGELDDEKMKKSIESISNNMDRIRSIVDAMRTFSKEDYTAEFSEVNLSDVVDMTIEICRLEIEWDNVRVENFLVGKNVPQIHANPGLIERVFINLFKNAYQEIHTQTDPWIKIERIDIDNPDHLVISVTDSGQGMTEELAEQIMDPFFTTKEIGKGTGLGLSLCFNIMRMHGGHLKVNSSSNYTQFFLSFPLV